MDDYFWNGKRANKSLVCIRNCKEGQFLLPPYTELNRIAFLLIAKDTVVITQWNSTYQF